MPSVDLSTAWERGDHLPPLLAATIGEAVATLHERGPVERVQLCRASPERDIHRPDPELLSRWSAGEVALVRMIQRSDVLCRALDRIEAGDRTHFVHGDLRWANILVLDGATPADVRLVDWEFSGLGDPRWDVGCFITEALSVWLETRHPARLDVEGFDPDNALPNDPIAWISLFLDSYLGHRTTGPIVGADFTIGAFRSAAVRLIHDAFAIVATSDQVSWGAVVRLQLAANILSDPLAAGVVFGAPAGASTLERLNA